MNVNTGAIYETDFAISEALQRGEPIVQVSRQVARLMKSAKRRKRERAKQRRAMQHASRRANR